MNQRASWSGQIAFVLAASAASIGLGNLWRFPYLAARYGGGTFICIYLLLVVTLGFTLMLSETAIGRLTQRSQLGAYSRMRPGWGFIGVLATVVPLLIVPYYCVIGGWVLRYFVAYLEMVATGAGAFGAGADPEAFFKAFITADFAPLGYGTAFVLASAAVIALGVKNGIERSNLVMMPGLFVLAIALSIYVVLMPGSGDGLRYYFIPSLDALSVPSEGGRQVFSFAQLGRTVLGAMGQMFYSLSLAMGIMITYGSYMRKSDSIERSVRKIEFFDTLVAIVAGLMIVPVVYMFAVKTGTSVKAAMEAGPGLIFIILPKVFATFGVASGWVGLAFFALVTFAALTSAISLFEACVSACCERLAIGRKTATAVVTALVCVLEAFPALGYGVWGDVRLFGLQFLDFLDFITNSVLMPVVAALTCVFIGWVVKPRAIIDEVESEGRCFRAKGLYVFMVKYFAPVFVIAILVSEVCRVVGLGGWSI